MILKKKQSLIISSIFVLLGLSLSWFYRPYIYNNNIYDFHFSDTIGNIFGFSAWLYFFFATAKKKYNLITVLVSGILFFTAYEFLAFWGTTDKYDVLATLLSAFLNYIFLSIFKIDFKNETTFSTRNN